MDQNTTWRPTPKQARVLACARKPKCNQSIEAICEEAGINRGSFYKWMGSDPGFKSAWQGLWKSILDENESIMASALVDRAKAGNVPALRLAFEIQGRVKTKHELSGLDGKGLFDFSEAADEVLHGIDEAAKRKAGTGGGGDSGPG